MKIKISGVGVILMLVIRANVIFNRTPLFKKKYFQGSENWVDNMSTDDNIPSPDWSGAAWYRFLVGFFCSDQFLLSKVILMLFCLHFHSGTTFYFSFPVKI